MTEDVIPFPRTATEPRSEESESPALSIYEHFLGLQRLRSWLREN